MSIGCAAVAQWKKRLTLNGQTRVRIREAHSFDITFLNVTRKNNSNNQSPDSNALKNLKICP